MNENMDFEYVDFELIREPWNLYELEDSAKLKFKLVLIKVVPIKDEPKNFKVNTANIVGVLTPKNMKDTPTPPASVNENDFAQKDLKFKVIEEDWGEYKLKDGTVLKIKPAITEISRTKSFDGNGEPIYVVRSQVLLKVIK